jgi:3-deoxy-manno-octulosonate cytidylyltransferase (CMP-KDO synthetase)
VTGQRDVAVIIPARLESTRLPRKALRLLAGRPLIEHVWRRVKRCRAVCGVFVATDSPQIAKVVEQFGGVPVLTSPACPSGTDRVYEALCKVGAWGAVNVQGDEPFISPAAVDAVAMRLLELGGRSVVTLARAEKDARRFASPDVVKVVLDLDDSALYFSRAPIPFANRKGAAYYEHVGVYGYTRTQLKRYCAWRPSTLEKTERLEQLRFLEHGSNIHVMLTRHKGFGIDTPADLRRAELQIKRGDRSW